VKPRRSPRSKRPVKCKLCHDHGKVLQTRKVGLLGLTERKVIPCPECQAEVTP
jgi:DnaJ-class molecular chaperone